MTTKKLSQDSYLSQNEQFSCNSIQNDKIQDLTKFQVIADDV